MTTNTHPIPTRLQHLLSRAVPDDQKWPAGRLDDGDAVLIVDETGDANTSAATAAPQPGDDTAAACGRLRVVPVVVLLCNLDEMRHLAARTNPESLKENWTIARDHRKWKSRQLTLVMTGHETDREITNVA